MKNFFSKTYYFWFISRILLIIAFSSAVINQFDLYSKSKILVTSFITFLIFNMLNLFEFEILKKRPSLFAKQFVGIVSIFCGFLLIYLILFVGENKYGFKNFGFLIVPFWIMLCGLWELKKETKIKQI
ncbi:hypothetical protein [Flavobacterium sp. ACAM 123]|uniref:hypothetical protein n=1 Tax=Flavobacterium sp. ACAM 123 TaxID=1189620 RepID=UPI0018DD92A0|nr:hypothetical protein [Flavobacterium sp. ACAM 123]